MKNVEWLLEMTVRLAGLSVLTQEDDPRLPVELNPVPARRATVAAPPSDLQFTYSSVNPQLLDRMDLASWHEAGGDLFNTVIGYDPHEAVWLKALRIAAAGTAQFALDFASHEFGHFSSFSRAGCRDFVMAPDDEAAASWGSPTVIDFLTGAFEKTPTPVGVSVSDWARIDAIFAGRPAEFAEFMVLTEAGGLNQEQVSLSGLSERMSEGGLPLLKVVPFMLGATSTLRYPASRDQSDLTDYIHALDTLGVRADLSTIRLLSTFRFLSGTGLALMGAFLSDLVGGGNGELRPLRMSLGEASHVDWPEFESYLSRYGPTLKTSIALNIQGVDVRPSFESSFAGGDRTYEAGLRAKATAASWLQVQGAAYVGDEGGYWVEGGVEARPLSWLTLGASYVNGSGYTVHREIFGANLPMIDSSESGVRLTLGITWTF